MFISKFARSLFATIFSKIDLAILLGRDGRPAGTFGFNGVVGFVPCATGDLISPFPLSTGSVETPDCPPAEPFGELEMFVAEKS